MAINRGLMTSRTPEWYTPARLVDLIVCFLDGITLDPCADPDWQVRAEMHYTPPVYDGLQESWQVYSVYCNPPYGRTIGKWVERFCTQPFSEGILLVPARTDTAWFAPLFSYPICFVRGRLKFSGATNSAPFPSAIVYRGPAERHAAFAEAFGDLGAIMVNVTTLAQSASFA